jgi:hypothetical protein
MSAMRKFTCWAIRVKGGYANWDHTDYVVRTCLFQTKAHAEVWCKDQEVHGRPSGTPVRVKVTIEPHGWQEALI